MTDSVGVLLVTASSPEFIAGELYRALAGADAAVDPMRVHRLTAYDAVYLEPAIRLGLPLATKDRELIAAAPACGVALFAVGQ